MIKDGKKSVTRDLVMFLECINEFVVKRHERWRNEVSCFIENWEVCRCTSKWEGCKILRRKIQSRLGWWWKTRHQIVTIFVIFQHKTPNASSTMNF